MQTSIIVIQQNKLWSRSKSPSESDRFETQNPNSTEVDFSWVHHILSGVLVGYRRWRTARRRLPSWAAVLVELSQSSVRFCRRRFERTSAAASCACSQHAPDLRVHTDSDSSNTVGHVIFHWDQSLKLKISNQISSTFVIAKCKQNKYATNDVVA